VVEVASYSKGMSVQIARNPCHVSPDIHSEIAQSPVANATGRDLSPSGLRLAIEHDRSARSSSESLYYQLSGEISFGS
jgi:hypothetical protein